MSIVLNTVIYAQNNSDLNTEQLALRADLVDFLKVEGFMPSIDSDGDIAFKYQGQNFYISVSSTDEHPMYVSIFRPFNKLDDYSMETLLMATKELNLYKGVKIICLEESFSVRAEMFVMNSESVKYAFYKLVEIINQLVDDVIEECEKVDSYSSTLNISNTIDIPFLITEVEVANVDKDNNIIDDYGDIIFDFETKYLKPRITIKPIKASGTYTIYVRLYKEGVLQKNSSSSPDSYTFSNEISINGNSLQTFKLSGWGNNTSGNWDMGTYRYEIWYNGFCLGSKTFEVI